LCVDETNAPVTEELAKELSLTGRIVLYFYFIEHLESVKPAEIPQLANKQFSVLSEKALHKFAAVQGDELSHQTRYTLRTRPHKL
jgi:predicted Zn-dependent peptidase